MQTKKGIGASPGVAISTALVLDAEDYVVSRRTIDAKLVAEETSRFNQALESACTEIIALRDLTHQQHGKDVGAIFGFHLGLLRDPTIIDPITASIREQSYSAEHAVSVVMREIAGRFQRMQDRFFSERVKDLHDIERRLLRILIGKQHTDLQHLDHDVILVAHDLLPSQAVVLDRTHVKGFATDVGGRTGHTAIIARSMGIPAVVGLGDVTLEVSGGDQVIIDGTRGVVIISPDPSQLDEHIEYRRKLSVMETDLRKDSALPAVTQDGHRITILANIEFPSEVDDAVGRGAEGVGLYRTEYLYLASDHEPTEQEHYLAYADAIKRLGQRPITIRTVDLGADKYTKANSANPEPNPFLGDRSIRLCLHDIPMFKRQLRAIMRASVLGDVRIMFPMITTLLELRQAKMILGEVIEELEDEGVPVRRDIPIGAMIEVPAAALMADQLAREVQFFSIGTNDLIQYTLAVDRTNERVAGLFSPLHPAVLELIRQTFAAAKRAQIPCSVCGEMAGEPLYTLLLLGLGLELFSMNAPDLPEVKRIIRSTTMDHARWVAQQVMGFDTERQAMYFLREEGRKLLPDAF